MSDEILVDTLDAARVATFSPLRHRNYRLLWSGLVVSNAGSWMQFTALGYLMDQLTRAPVYLGVLGLAAAVPRLLFAFVGGVVADRVDRRRVLLITNLFAMASGFLLAGLTYTGVVQVWHLLVIAAFNSLVHSFDMPARQSMTPALVTEPELLQAVTLNSVAFNGAGVFGPAVAGVLISAVGTHGAFAANGLSYLAVLWALLAMDLPRQLAEARVSFSEDLREGLGLLGRNRAVAILLVAIALLSFFGRPYIRLMPAVAREVLHVGPRALGLLQAAPGVGTILAVFITGWSRGRLAHGGLVLGAALAMGATVTLFGLSASFELSLATLVGVGLSQSVAMATANTLIQTSVAPTARGRAMGLFGTVAFGMMALGTLPIGALADILGLPWSLAAGGLALVASMGAIAWLAPWVRRL